MWVSVRSEHGAKLEMGKGFCVLCNLDILKLDLNLSHKLMLSKMFLSFEMVDKYTFLWPMNIFFSSLVEPQLLANRTIQDQNIKLNVISVISNKSEKDIKLLFIQFTNVRLEMFLELP